MVNKSDQLIEDATIVKKQRRNLFMLYFMVFAIISVIWLMYFEFIKYDKQATITQYKARHHGLLILAEDLVYYTKDSMGPMGLRLLEDLMVNASDLSKKSIERKKLQQTIDSSKELVGYGNMLIFFKNEPVLASGQLEEYFTRDGKKYSITNEEVEKTLLAVLKNAKSPEGNIIKSETVNIGGKSYLVTCAYYETTPSRASVVLYTEVDKILHVYGFYSRKRVYFFISLFLSLMNIVWGVFLGKGMEKQYRALLSEKNMTGALQTEVAERKKAELELKRHQESLETTVKEKTDELRETHEQLLHAQKMEAIGHLAGGMAHEFNNILATISGTAEMLMKYASEDNGAHDRAERIVRSANRAKSLTTKLLTFARKEKLNIVVISVNDLLKEAIDVLESTISKQIKIRKELGEDAGEVSVDANQITQAILNVCINACDAMVDSGVLTITTQSVMIEDANREGNPHKFSAITISDTGPGIDPAIVDRIFDPFFTTKEKDKGTGLGLSVCHGIIGAHSGTIELLSAGKEGTSFRILLPCYEVDDQREKRDVICEDESKVKSGKILIIDDDAAFIEMVQEALESEGFEVVAKQSGSEGISAYKENKDVFDVVMLDLMMSEMDGSAVFNNLIEFDPCVKIILCSGYSVEGAATSLLEKGAVNYIQKPFSLSELIGVFSKTLQNAN